MCMAFVTVQMHVDVYNFFALLLEVVYQIWVQNGPMGVWPQMGQVLPSRVRLSSSGTNHKRSQIKILYTLTRQDQSTEILSEKVPDLSHLCPI